MKPPMVATATIAAMKPWLTVAASPALPVPRILSVMGPSPDDASPTTGPPPILLSLSVNRWRSSRKRLRPHPGRRIRLTANEGIVEQQVPVRHLAILVAQHRDQQFDRRARHVGDRLVD